MRTATLILGLLAVVILLLQSCAIAGVPSFPGSSSAADTPSESVVAGGVGLVAAFYGIIGLAFVFRNPLVSVIAFLLAALIAALGPMLGFTDGKGWAVALSVLSLFALMGHLGMRRKKRREDARNKDLLPSDSVIDTPAAGPEDTGPEDPLA